MLPLVANETSLLVKLLLVAVKCRIVSEFELLPKGDYCKPDAKREPNASSF